MKDIDDITNALAAKYGAGLEIEEKKAQPKPEPVRRTDYSPARVSGIGTGPRLFPSEKMALKTYKQSGRPNRPPVLMALYSDDELEWMLSTPVKRGWDFQAWLEVIGLPRDLTEGYDGAMYQYAARAFLDLKKEAHKA